MDSFSYATLRSYGKSRLDGSQKKLILGPICLLIGIWVLFSNEGKLVRQQKTINYAGLKIVSEVSPTREGGIDPSKEGKLVHLIGTAQGMSTVQDSLFRIQPPSETLVLRRDVLMYQWVEVQRNATKMGSSKTRTTYKYKKEWRQEVVPSEQFAQPEDHENPSSMRFSSSVDTASPIQVGDYRLPYVITDQMRTSAWYKSYNDDSMTVSNITDGDIRNDAQLYGNGFYFGSDPVYPQVGDLHVFFETIPQQTISIVAQQVNNSFSSYVSKKTKGDSILLVEPGVHDATEMFSGPQPISKHHKWILRLVGFIFIFAAFQLAMDPLSTIADVIPFLGDLLETGSNTFAFIAASATSLVVVGLSWILYRPLFSLFLFGIVGGAFYYWRKKKNTGPSPSSLSEGGGGNGGGMYSLLGSSNI